MPTRPQTECAKPGCHALVTSGYCDAHKTEPQVQSAPRRNEKFYQTRLWRTTSTLLRQYNPICQRIQPDGVQCTHASTVVHHIVDPSVNPAVGTDWNNIVALCDTCHPGGQPGDTEHVQYVHTYAPCSAVYRHTRHADWYSGPPDTEPVVIPPGAFGTDPSWGITAVVSSVRAPAAVAPAPGAGSDKPRGSAQ